MSVNMDDKLLGEKGHYYCSSSEDEDDKKESPAKEEEHFGNINNYNGTCVNTGPKGVLKDWRAYKQLESERRENQEAERVALMKKLSLTCRSPQDDEKEKDDEELLKELEEMEDEFMQKYREQRLEEMRKYFNNAPTFGKVFNLSSDEFLTAVDNEKPQVTVIVHVYEESTSACEAMNGCFVCLAKEFPSVKFCKITAADAMLSGHFAANGVPALLVYRNKGLVGNFIRLSDELGEDFYATDVESFLVEHGFLPCQDIKVGIKDSQSNKEEENDSDYDIDY